MSKTWLYETQKALQSGEKMQKCYNRLLKKAPNPEVKALIDDLLRMEEMNALLLRKLQGNI